MQASGVSNPVERHGGYRHYLALAGIFLFTLIIHARSPVTTSTDSAWTFHVAGSILREHNLDLDEYRDLIDLQLDYRLRSIRGHIYSYYPVATPLLVAPFVWLANQLYPLSHQGDYYSYLAQNAPNERTAMLERLLASGFVSLSAAVMYLIARRRLDVTGAFAIALMFGFSTSMWSTASRALWQHGPSVLFLTLALYFTLTLSENPLWVFITGLVLAFAYVVRPTNSLSFVILGSYFLINRRRISWLFPLGGFVVLLPYVLQNWFTYGNLFPPYSYQLFERFGTPLDITEAALGTLFSPGRGLFVFTPLFLFSIYGAVLSTRTEHLSFSNLDPYLIGIVVTHWITTSLFEDWGGAWSIGPRYFVDIIPFLVYFLIPVIQRFTLLNRPLRSTFYAAVILSTLIQSRGAVSRYPFMWNGKPQALVDAPERKWDWGDLQFLRGLCPDDPLEGRAPACWFHLED